MCNKKNVHTEVLSQSVTQWTKARARFTAGIPKNTGINICWRIRTRDKEARSGGRERGTRIKMDGANRMLIERSFIFSLYQFGEVTRGHSVARRSDRSPVYIEQNRTSSTGVFFSGERMKCSIAMCGRAWKYVCSDIRAYIRIFLR